jgi:hypothetical protein
MSYFIVCITNEDNSHITVNGVYANEEIVFKFAKDAYPKALNISVTSLDTGVMFDLSKINMPKNV